MAPQNTDSPLPGEMPGKSGPLLNRTLIIFLTGMILANIASRMNNPMIPLYVQSLGASVQQVGFFFTITSVAPLAFQILGGFVSDSIGRLQAIAIGSIAGIVGYVLTLLRLRGSGLSWHRVFHPLQVALLRQASKRLSLNNRQRRHVLGSLLQWNLSTW